MKFLHARYPSNREPKLHWEFELTRLHYLILKFSPRTGIDLTGVPERGWGGSGPLDPLASAVPVYVDC